MPGGLGLRVGQAQPVDGVLDLSARHRRKIGIRGLAVHLPRVARSPTWVLRPDNNRFSTVEVSAFCKSTLEPKRTIPVPLPFTVDEHRVQPAVRVLVGLADNEALGHPLA